MRVELKRLCLIIGIFILLGLVYRLAPVVLRWLMPDTQPSPGLLIGNSGSEVLKEVRVSYPGGSYVVSALRPGASHLQPIKWRLPGPGEVNVALDITYIDGRRFHREEHIFLGPDTFLQIAIEDDAQLHLR